MCFLKLSLALALALGAATARGDFDVAPYAFGGKVVTGGHDDVLGSDNITQQVFGYNFFEDPLDPYLIGDPGFNNGTFMIGVYPNNGVLPAFATLGFDVLTNLRYWNGAGAVSFSAAPIGVDLGIRRGSTTVDISGLGQSGTVPTIGSTGAPGRLHVHVESQLNFTDGTNPSAPNAPDGVYMFGLRLTLPGSGVANSDPIYFVYNANVSEAVHDEAIDWVQTTLVPEPSTWVLMTTALGAIVGLRWKRRGDNSRRSSAPLLAGDELVDEDDPRPRKHRGVAGRFFGVYVRPIARKCEIGAAYANSSLITLPPSAIFIGRPLRLVKVVSSEMPSALQTVAMASWAA